MKLPDKCVIMEKSRAFRRIRHKLSLELSAMPLKKKVRWRGGESQTSWEREREREREIQQVFVLVPRKLAWPNNMFPLL
jgi:hypothetical protein